MTNPASCSMERSVRHYHEHRRAGTAFCEPSKEGRRAYREELRRRAGTSPRATRTRRELEADVVDLVAAQVAPRSSFVAVDARGLRDMLAPYKKLISRSPYRPILASVRLATAGDLLFAVGTNLEAFLESYMATEPDPAELSVAVPFEPLLEAAKAATPRSKRQAAQVKLEAAGEVLTVTSGPMTRTIPLLDKEEFPATNGLDGAGAYKLDGPAFAAAAKAVWRTISGDEARPVLNAGLLRLEGERLTLASTDSYRLTERHVPLTEAGRAGTGEALIQREIVKLAVELFGKADKVSVLFRDGKALLFTTGRSLHVRSVEGDFPKYRDLIPQVSEDRDYGMLSVDQDALAAALANVPKNRGRASDSPVHLVLHEGKVEVISDVMDVGRSETIIAAHWNGEDGLRIGFNPGFLADALTALDGPLTWYVKDGLKPALFRSPDTDGLYLLMPVRLP